LIVVLRLEGDNAVAAARWLLRVALRKFHLRATDVREVTNQAAPPANQGEVR